MSARPTTVLLIEHVPADARRMRQMLSTSSRADTGDAAFHVVHTASLDEALALAPDFTPNVVVLELETPGVDRRDALAALLDRWPETAVIGLGPAGSTEADRPAGMHDRLGNADLDSRLLVHSIARAVENARLTRELARRVQIIATAESQVRTLLDTVADGVLVLDEAGVVRFASPAALDIYERSADQMVGQPFGVPLAGLKQAEVQVPRSDGTVRFVELRTAHTTWYCAPAMLASLRDLTAHKQADEALQRERDVIARIADASPAGLVTLDRSGQITFANRMAERVLGLARDTITRRSYNAPDWVITDYDGRPFPDAELPFNRVMATGQPVFDVRHAIQWPDGRRRLLSINATPLSGTTGDVEGVVAMVQDVTEPVRIETALRESETRARSVVESIPLGMHMCELQDDGRLVLYAANPAAARILDTDHDPLIGRTIEEAFPGLIGTEVPDAYRRVARTGEPWHREEVAYHEGRISGAFEVHAFQTSPGRMTAAFQDITLRRQSEERMRRANRALRLLSDCNQAMVRAAGEPELLHEMCRVIVEQGGYRMAWVGVVEDDPEKTVQPVAGAGHDAGFLDMIRVSWAEEEPGRPSIGTAIRTGAAVVIRDLAAVDQNVAPWPWLEAALERGYRSMISLPVSVDQQILGALTIYAGEPYAFDDDEVVLLQEMAADLGFGIASLRLQADQQRAQQALEASEQKYRQLVQHAPAGIYEVDFVNRRLTSVNDLMCEYTGYSREEFLALNPLDLLTDDSRPVFLERLQRVFAGETVPGTVEFRIRGKNGREFWVLLNSSWRYEQGRVVGATVVAHDITTRRQTEEQTRQREALLQKVLEILPVGLWIADARGRLQVSNPAGVRIWGGEPLGGQDEYRVFKARRLPSGEEVTPDDWALNHTINEGVTVTDELLEIDAFDGVKRTILNSTAPVLDDDGRVEAAIVVNQDVTALVKAEEARERLQAQLLQAQKMEAVGRLTAGIAHDFNNLLTAIMGFSGLMQRKLRPDDPLNEYVTKVLESSQTAANLVQQLMAFSRQQVRRPEVMDINHALAGMERMLRRIIGEHIALATELAPDLWAVEVDATQLQQAIINLAVNARDAMPGGGRLTVQTANVSLDDSQAGSLPGARPGDYVRIAISDTGHGMSEEVLSHLFEPFFTTKPPGKGTGLGLATVYGIVQQSDGAIGVQSAPGRGATFTVYLPRVVAPPPAAAGNTAEPASLPGGHETILLAEDNPGVRALAHAMLQQLGYTVLEAENGRRALETAAHHPGPIHLLLTDLVMPDLGGAGLAEQLAAARPPTKVLFMSGYSEEVTADQGMPMQGAEFVQKPFKLHDLAHKVRQVLDTN